MSQNGSLLVADAKHFGNERASGQSNGRLNCLIPVADRMEHIKPATMINPNLQVFRKKSRSRARKLTRLNGSWVGYGM